MSGKPSLDFALAEMKARAEAQDKQVATLDTKVNFVLTSASVLIAGAAAFQKVISTAPDLEDIVVLYIGATAVMLIYVKIVHATILAFTPRTYKRAPEPCGLKKSLTQNVDETKEDVFNAMVDAFNQNAPIVEEKAAQTQKALRWLLGEAVCLAVWLIVLMVTQLI